MKIRYTPKDLLVHRNAMSLLDEICDWGQDWLEGLVTHKEGAPFADESGKTPSWIGLEYMCQSIAALEGTHRKMMNKPVSMGFVLGTKKYQAYVPFFSMDQIVRIRVKEEMKNDTSLGVYSCEIVDINDQTLVIATIKAAMPEDPKIILESKRKVS